MIRSPCYDCEQQGTDACSRDACEAWDKFIEACETEYDRMLLDHE